MRVNALVVVGASCAALAASFASAQDKPKEAQPPEFISDRQMDELVDTLPIVKPEIASEWKQRRDERQRAIVTDPDRALAEIRRLESELVEAASGRTAAERQLTFETWGAYALIAACGLAIALAAISPYLVAHSKAHEGRYAILGGAVVSAVVTFGGFAAAAESERGAIFALPCTIGALAWFALLVWSVYPGLLRGREI